ncbi:NUDIX domain-containing protein [Planosporangium mesophilum]|uniref:NUDIX hydrolase n=1 Tax=Planosporangium mesophilum TaxID=689768 RepID=A0A8J3WZ16_9ACTN|nr:NUDIX domain-containing protein [Planosporangium mesophilum]NJC83393.1 NUDIX domain-containing protein [Planosporangium mesophilum]GII21772.1 NUDIX hydrolase [Planosporangium mesophilum]
MQHSHCSYCGSPYTPETPWPRECSECGETTWRNPLPVAVALLPVDGVNNRGLVVVRRDIEPARGQLALPGGYIEVGESWQEATVRELREETGLVADPAEVTLFAVHSAPMGTVNIFGLLPARRADDLPPSAPTEEATEWLVLTEPRRLAFSTHTQAIAEYFASTYFASA